MTTPRTRALTRPPTDAGQWLTYVELATLRRIDRHSAVKLVGRHGWRRQKDNRGTLRIFVPPDWAKAPNKGTDSATNTGTGRGAADITAFETALTAFETALTAVEAAHASEVASLREQIATAEAARIAAQAMVEQFAGVVRDGEEAARVERARSAAEFAEVRQCEARSAREASDAGQAASQAAQERAERARADALRMRQRAAPKVDELQVDLGAARDRAQKAEHEAATLREAEAVRKGRGVLARLRAALRGE
jgi:hypothetical protein